jgi:hypothetical protein
MRGLRLRVTARTQWIFGIIRTGNRPELFSFLNRCDNNERWPLHRDGVFSLLCIGKRWGVRKG